VQLLDWKCTVGNKKPCNKEEDAGRSERERKEKRSSRNGRGRGGGGGAGVCGGENHGLLLKRGKKKRTKDQRKKEKNSIKR